MVPITCDINTNQKIDNEHKINSKKVLLIMLPQQWTNNIIFIKSIILIAQPSLQP